jgi:hypothetical protein
LQDSAQKTQQAFARKTGNNRSSIEQESRQDPSSVLEKSSQQKEPGARVGLGVHSSAVYTPMSHVQNKGSWYEIRHCSVCNTPAHHCCISFAVPTGSIPTPLQKQTSPSPLTDSPRNTPQGTFTPLLTDPLAAKCLQPAGLL